MGQGNEQMVCVVVKQADSNVGHAFGKGNDLGNIALIRASYSADSYHLKDQSAEKIQPWLSCIIQTK